MQTLANGTQLGAYTIVRLIGRGGMGEVYEAFEERLQRRVAIKVITPQKAGTHGEVDLVRRFLQEARTLAQVNHPNVVTIYAIDRIQETQFIAMEFVDGALLKDILSVFALSADEATPMFMQMLEGLRSLHENKILHRDLKPHNLMLRPNGQVKILDFGIAKREGDRDAQQTTQGVVVGTLAYLPPEVLYGAPATVRSDLWSLGAIFYECLVGQPLVSMHNIKVKGVRASAESDVIFPQDTLAWVPVEMREIVAKLCDKIPDNRYSSAAQALEDMKRYQQTRPPLPAAMFSSLAKNVENIADFKRTIDEKNLTGPKAKRALALAMITGVNKIVPEATMDRVEQQKPITQEIKDSITSRRRARRRKRKNFPWASVALGLAVVVVVCAGLVRAFSHKSEAPVHLEPPTAAQIPAAPTVKLNEPPDKQNLWLEPTQIPTFGWSKPLVSGDYALQLTSEETSNRVLFSEPVSGISYRPLFPLPEGHYSWALVPLRDQPELKAANHFTVSWLKPIELVRPKPGEVIDSSAKSVSLSWACKIGARSYRVQLAVEPSFQVPLQDRSVSTCGADLPLVVGTYFWRVRVEEPALTNLMWSEKRAFTLKVEAPTTPVANVRTGSGFETEDVRLEDGKMTLVLQFAAPARTIASSYKQLLNPPRLKWAPVRGAKSYELQMSASPDFSRVFAEERVTGSQFQWKQVVPGRTFWRVRATNEAGAHSEYSSRGRIDIRLPAPKFKAGEHNMLTWDPVPLADRYVVQSSVDRGMASVSEQVVGETAIPVVVKPQAVYIRVAALNAAGDNVSEFSSIATVSPPPPVVLIEKPRLLGPRQGAHAPGKSGRISVVFSWTKVEKATGYSIEIAADPNFSQLYDQQMVKAHGYLIKEAPLTGMIYWRVRAETPAGPSEWSAPFNFEVR